MRIRQIREGSQLENLKESWCCTVARDLFLSINLDSRGSLTNSSKPRRTSCRMTAGVVSHPSRVKSSRATGWFQATTANASSAACIKSYATSFGFEDGPVLTKLFSESKNPACSFRHNLIRAPIRFHSVEQDLERIHQFLKNEPLA